MKLALLTLLALGAVALAEERSKRQVNYQFPGPRQGGQQQSQPQDDSALYQQQPRRQFQAQPVQSYGAAPRQAAPQQQSYGAPPPQQARRPAASRPRYSDSQQNVEEAPEEESGPDPLALLLEGSKFTCGAKKDGYYADTSVQCQAFHYCVGGAKHSWMCPQGTSFHQVHLNCVPASQDATLCGQSEKFHFVNDYLHKTLDHNGPNNTIRYAQRYYPDGYTIGDTFIAPQGGGGDQYQQGPPPQQGGGYGAPPPQYRPQASPPQQAPQYAPQQSSRSAYGGGAPPPRQYAPQAAAPQRAAVPQSAPQGYGGYPQGGSVPNLDDVRSLGIPQIPQQAPQQRRAPQPAPARAQQYGGGYSTGASGARQVRYDDDRGY